MHSTEPLPPVGEESDSLNWRKRAAHIVVTTSLAIGVGLAAAPASAITQVCGRNSAAPYVTGYTMEEGATKGKFRGHAWIAWQLPLPKDYRIEGPGGTQKWKNEHGLQKFLVNAAPGMYRMVWNVTCVDNIPPRHA